MSNQMFISNRMFVPLAHLSAHAVPLGKKLIDSNEFVLIGDTNLFFTYNNLFILNIVETRCVYTMVGV